MRRLANKFAIYSGTVDRQLSGEARGTYNRQSDIHAHIQANIRGDRPLAKPAAHTCANAGTCVHACVVSRFLSSSSTATLVHAFILNRLNYCSSLCLDLPYVRLRPLDGVLRAAARL